jgi:hypothetical protein
MYALAERIFDKVVAFGKWPSGRRPAEKIGKASQIGSK